MCVVLPEQQFEIKIDAYGFPEHAVLRVVREADNWVRWDFMKLKRTGNTYVGVARLDPKDEFLVVVEGLNYEQAVLVFETRKEKGLVFPGERPPYRDGEFFIAIPNDPRFSIKTDHMPYPVNEVSEMVPQP